MSFVINDMPPQINAALLDKCRRVETATIGHRRHMGFVDRRVQSVRPGARMAGTAVTLALPGMDSTLLHHAVQFLRPGDVLVVVDGPCTDFPEIEQYDLPVWCRGASPITTRLYGVGGSFNVPICCGGAVVMPGDVVVADFSGVVIMPPEEALGDVDWALDKAAAEPEAHRAMQAGEKLGERSGASRIVAENLSR